MKGQTTKIEVVEAGAAPSGRPCEAAQQLDDGLSGELCEQISPEILASIRSIVSFVRKQKIQVRSVKLLPTSSALPGWTTRGQGRIQTSHNLHDA
jgi:hypothetical protein